MVAVWGSIVEGAAERLPEYATACTGMFFQDPVHNLSD